MAKVDRGEKSYQEIAEKFFDGGLGLTGQLTIIQSLVKRLIAEDTELTPDQKKYLDDVIDDTIDRLLH